MTKQYFRQVPNFKYVDRNYNSKNIGNFTEVKNLFKRVKLRDEIFENLNFFSLYSIIGDERPDSVADKIYNDPKLDWLILLSNNILNFYNEWLMSNESFDNIMLEKYGSYEELNSISHYETEEVKNSVGKVIIPEGSLLSSNLVIDYRKLIIDEDGGFIENPDFGNKVPYFIEFYDEGTGNDVLVSNITNPITFKEVEERKENQKRQIYLLKKEYVPVIFDDLDRIMKYKKGATQFLSDTLKQGDNIRLYS
jgi:hypothetical protein